MHELGYTILISKLKTNSKILIFLLNIFRLTFSPRRELNYNYKDVLQVNRKKVYMNEIVFKD